MLAGLPPKDFANSKLRRTTPEEQGHFNSATNFAAAKFGQTYAVVQDVERSIISRGCETANTVMTYVHLGMRGTPLSRSATAHRANKPRDSRQQLSEQPVSSALARCVYHAGCPANHVVFWEPALHPIGYSVCAEAYLMKAKAAENLGTILVSDWLLRVTKDMLLAGLPSGDDAIFLACAAEVRAVILSVSPLHYSVLCDGAALGTDIVSYWSLHAAEGPVLAELLAGKSGQHCGRTCGVIVGRCSRFRHLFVVAGESQSAWDEVMKRLVSQVEFTVSHKAQRALHSLLGPGNSYKRHGSNDAEALRPHDAVGGTHTLHVDYFRNAVSEHPNTARNGHLKISGSNTYRLFTVKYTAACSENTARALRKKCDSAFAARSTVALIALAPRRCSLPLCAIYQLSACERNWAENIIVHEMNQEEFFDFVGLYGKTVLMCSTNYRLVWVFQLQSRSIAFRCFVKNVYVKHTECDWFALASSWFSLMALVKIRGRFSYEITDLTRRRWSWAILEKERAEENWQRSLEAIKVLLGGATSAPSPLSAGDRIGDQCSRHTACTYETFSGDAIILLAEILWQGSFLYASDACDGCHMPRAAEINCGPVTRYLSQIFQLFSSQRNICDKVAGCELSTICNSMLDWSSSSSMTQRAAGKRWECYSDAADISTYRIKTIAGAAVAERLAPTKAIRVQSPAGSPVFRMWESCRTMPLVGGFSRDLPFPPPFHAGAAPYSPQSPSSALKTSLFRAAQSLHVTSQTIALTIDLYTARKIGERCHGKFSSFHVYQKMEYRECTASIKYSFPVYTSLPFNCVAHLPTNRNVLETLDKQVVQPLTSQPTFDKRPAKVLLPGYASASCNKGLTIVRRVCPSSIIPPYVRPSPSRAIYNQTSYVRRYPSGADWHTAFQYMSLASHAVLLRVARLGDLSPFGLLLGKICDEKLRHCDYRNLGDFCNEFAIFGLLGRVLAQSSPSTVTADNQCTVDIDRFVHTTVESSLQVIVLVNFSVMMPNFHVSALSFFRLFENTGLALRLGRAGPINQCQPHHTQSTTPAAGNRLTFLRFSFEMG
ncbi:hypothetical protein PR048_021498 [Dryococelus australis]|uniref:Uncharacterized protein n=1 Tax=Dryococelus australis TaxID=614101 RepID=A0ABQ9GYD7_9NEOP|nr:hypothetical protein PR048_021498 [Dryococelus australis]